MSSLIRAGGTWESAANPELYGESTCRGSLRVPHILLLFRSLERPPLVQSLFLKHETHLFAGLWTGMSPA